jgi:hypothetical protein
MLNREADTARASSFAYAQVGFGVIKTAGAAGVVRSLRRLEGPFGPLPGRFNRFAEVAAGCRLS